MEPKYYKGIDLLKGVALVLVIAGHVLRGELHNTLSRYLIYSFHMPLFFALSGYLISQPRLASQGLTALLRKNFFRMLVPWFIAWAAYMVLWYFDPTVSYQPRPATLLKYLVFPGYHLWYVPALLAFILLLRLLVQFRLPAWAVLVFSLALAAVWLGWLVPGGQSEGGVSGLIARALSRSDLLASWAHYLEGKNVLLRISGVYRPHLFCFFCLGFFLRNRPFVVNRTALMLALTAGALLLRIHHFATANQPFYSIDLYLLDLMFIPAVISLLAKKNPSFTGWLEWIGKNSLPIYLWHIMILTACEAVLFEHLPLGLWYAATVAAMFLLYPFVTLLSKSRITDRYVLGNAPVVSENRSP